MVQPLLVRHTHESMFCTEKLFCKLLMNDMCQVNAFLMLNYHVMASPFDWVRGLSNLAVNTLCSVN